MDSTEQINFCSSITISFANGCNDSVSTTIDEPPLIIDSVAGNDVNCFGACDGQVWSIPSGGTPPYTHSWSNGGTNDTLFNVCAGTYVDTLTDANGCDTIASITINEPPPLTTALDSTNETCRGDCDGTATATSAGGSPPYTYIWSTFTVQTDSQATGLCMGMYTVTVTDNAGCILTDSIAVDAPPSLTTLTDSIDVFCNGGSTGAAIVIAAGGTPPYSYLWDDPGGQTTDTAFNLTTGTYCVTVTDAQLCQDTACVNIDEPPPIILTTDNNFALCFGACNGSAIVNASGGAGGFTYLWNDPGAQTTDTAIGLCSGTYQVIVTDNNGCSDSASVTISEPSILTLSITDSTNTSCFGICDGTATSLVTGGSKPYTYTWPGTSVVLTDSTAMATNLCAGSYMVLVTDSNGCQDSMPFNINEPPLLLLTTDSVDILCGGFCTGQALVIASGGTGVLTYLWDDPFAQTDSTATGLCVGLYKCVVSDANGCRDSVLVNIDEPDTLTSTMDSTMITCNGDDNGIGVITVAGGSLPYTYLWSDGQTTSTATGLVQGVFCVTVTDSLGCQDSGCVTISEPFPLTVTLLKTDITCNSFCDGTTTASPTGGTLPYTFLWNDPFGQTTSSATGLCPGTWTVVVTDSNGCTDIDSITITEPLSLSPNLSSISATCGVCDGVAVAAPIGGTSPYTFNWLDTIPPFNSNDSLINVCAGIYCVEIIDANLCVDTFCVAVNDLAGTVLTMSDTDITCNGACNGIGMANATGGIAPYTYLWNDPLAQTDSIATGLCAGTWFVQVEDASTCHVFDSITITEPPILLQVLTTTDVLCFGDCN